MKVAEWLHETRGAKGMVGTVFSMFALKSIVKAGFELVGSISLPDYEFNGIKPYKGMKPSPHYPNQKPEIFTVAYHCKKKEKEKL